MADIKLVRPSAGQTAVIPSAPDARMVLDFSADQVSIERPQGSDSLFFRFDDGAAIELQNFYTQYNKDDIPSFEVDGQLIAGADFFNAFGPDLAPAAGPSASPTRSGRYSDFANAGLEDGVNHLDGLDYRLGFGGDTQPNINPYASPFLTNAAPTLSTGGAAIAIGLTESAWDGKTASAAPVVSQSGSFSVADPDGDSLTSTVSMGGKVVAVSTAGPTTVESDYGTLVITPSGGGSNITFTYTYTLKQDPDSPTDSLAQGEKQADNIVFSINDGQGHTVTQPINVVITGSNDAPDITGVGSTLTLKESGVYADQPVGDKLHADELNGAPGVQATLSGTITAHDPDHGAQLYFGLKDVNGNLLDMTSVNADGTLKGTFVIGSVNNPDHTASDVVVTGIAEQGGQIVISTNYGDLVLGKTSDTTATYTFTLKNADGEGATNKLAEGQQVSLKFEPYVRDEHGAEDGNSSTLRDGTAAGNAIVINILGTNDAPTITQNAWNGQSGSTALSATLTEASDSTAQSSVTGTIIGHDVDNGDSLHYGLIQPGSDTMHGKVYVVLASDGHTLTTTTDASTAATAKNYVGEFTLTEDADPTKGASYKFTLYNDSPAVQGMQDGDSQDVSIGLVARDSFGAYVQESVSVTVKGANDTPVITTAPTLAALSVVELGVKNVHGDPNEAFAGTSKDADSGHSFTVTDVDNNDTQAVSIAVKELPGAAFKDNHDGTYTVTTPEGTFTLTAGAAVANDSGSSKTYTYSYELNNSASETQALHEGETRNYTFTVTVTDSKGAHVDQAVSLTITGTNDQPQLTITPGDSGTLKEDAATTTSAGTWAVADPDNDGASQTLSIAGMGQAASGSMNINSHAGSPVSVATDYGTLTLKSDGTYTYELDNSKPAVQKLGEGQSHTESFTVTTTDIHGANHSQAITVVINGTNDNPVIGSSVIAVDVIEKGVQGSHDPAHSNDLFNGTVAAQGYVTATDVDDNDNSGGKPALTFSVAAGTGTTVDNSGTNSATTVTTSYGTLVIDPKTGAYTYTLDNTKADALNENQKVTETFVVKVADGHGGSVTQPITVTITGTNDRPDLSLAAPSASSFKEDSGSYQASGTFTVADADADGAFKGSTNGAANHSYAIAGGTSGGETTTGTVSVDPGTGVATYTTKFGVLTVNPDGTYKYDLNNGSNAVQNLGEGQTHTETFQVKVTDLHGSTDTETVSFTITGTNDQTLIDKTSGTLTVKEAGVVSLADPAHTGSGSSIPGYNNVAANGSKLNDGSKAVSGGSFTVTDMDTNDVLKATLSSSSGINVSKLPVLNGAGTWTVNDTYGTLTVTGVSSVNSDGSESITYSYSYAVNQTKTASLAEGETKTLNYTISVTDGHGNPVAHNIAINVQGTNDAPTVTGKTLTLKDDGRLDGGNAQMPSGTGDPAAHGNSYKDSVEGALTGKDSDTGATLTYGLITATSGANAYKHLGTDSGELSTGSVAGTFVKDGVTQTTAIGADMVASTGAYPGTGGGNATVINVYAAGQPHSAESLYGTLYLNEATGKYTFTLATGSNAVNALGSGEKLTLNFKAVAVDEHSASSTAITIPIVIYGTNDKPVLTLTDSSLEVTDGGPVSDTALAGSVKVTDADVNDSHTFGIVDNSVTETGNTPAMTSSVAGNYGTLSINQQTGEYTYTLAKNNAAVISLDKGETLPETFQIAVVDKYGAYSLQTITVTINGKDDPTIINTGWVTPSNAVVESGVNPVTSAAAAANAAKMQDGSAGVRTATGYIGAHDADTTDNNALASAAESAKLHYVIQVDGKNCDLNALMAGTGLQTGTASIDADGKLTLTGGSASTLDVGQAAKDASGNIVIKLENGSLTISKDTSHTDANGASVFKYVYTVDNTDADVQEKNFHEHTEDNFSVVVHDTATNTDVAKAPVSIRIEGANDRPIITQAPAVTLTESDAHSTTGQVELLDYEQTGGTAQTVSSGFTFSLVKSTTDYSGDTPVQQGTYGRLIIDQATGEYRYERTEDLTSLANGSSVTDTFYVRVKDADGAYSEIKPIVITITGEDAAGKLTGNALTVKEDGVTGSIQGVLHYTEADKLGANKVQPVDASGGTLAAGVIRGHLGVNDPDTNLDADGHALKNLTAGAEKDSYSTYTYKTLSYTDGTGTHDVGGSGNATAGYDYKVGDYGTLHVNEDGSYTFTPNTSSTAFNGLAQGENVNVNLGITAHSDSASHGQSIDGSLSITINGTNDVPVVKAAAPSFTVQDYTDAFTGGNEDASFTTLANPATAITYLTDHPDLIRAYVTQGIDNIMDEVKSHSGPFGKIIDFFHGWDDVQNWLTKVANGAAKTLDDFGRLDNLLTSLNLGKDVSSFLSTVVGAERVIVVDSDEIAGWSNGSLFSSPSGDPVVRGTLNTADLVTDKDHGSSLTFFAVEKGGSGNLVQEIKGEYGTLIISPNGTYQYVLDRAGSNYQNYVKNHASGDTTTETFTIYARDDHNAVAEKPIELIINVGKMGDSVGGDGTKSGNLPIKDVADSVQEDGLIGEQHTGKTVTAGSVTPSNNGKYDADMFLIDGAGHETSVISDKYGTITLLPNGRYSYTLNNDHPDVQALTKTDTIIQKFTVTNGSDYRTITITINGSNDKPYVVSQSDTVALEQHADGTWAQTDPSGSFTLADVDRGETDKLEPTSYTVAGKLGGIFTVTKGSNGNFSYTYAAPAGGTNYSGHMEDSAMLTLSNGNTAGDKVEVKLSADLNYANDKPSAPVLVAGSDVAVTEDSPADMVAKGSITATDPDVTAAGAPKDALSFAIVGSDGKSTGMVTDKDYGTLIMGKDGKYEFHLNTSSEAVQQLGDGKSHEVTFTVRASDGHGGYTDAPLTITVNGVNDAPVITLHADGSSVAGSGAALFVADGQANLTVGGTAVTYDVDAGDSLTLKLNGQAIASGSTSVTEDVYAYKDASGWHVGTSASSGAVLMGLLELNKDGTYNFQGDKGGIAHLAQGETLTIDARIGVSDAAGATDTAKVAVTITGTNDSPKMEAFNADATTLTDNGASVQTLSGTIAATDVDGDTLTYYIMSGGKYVTELHDGHGTLKLDGKNYTYTLDAAYAKSLEAQGKDVATAGGSFTVVTMDKYGVETSQTLAITLKGVNNDPTFTAPSLSIVEGASPLTGNLGAADVDTTDALTYSLAYGSNSATASGGTNAVVDGHYGQLTLDASGNYKYTLTNHELAQGAQATETFTVTVNDGQGGTVSHDVVVNITGTNDAPVAHLDASSHALSATDVDLGDHLAFSVNGHELNAVPQGTTEVHGAFGTLTFTADETHKDMFSYGDYKLDSSYDSISKLAALHDAGSDLKDTFGYTVSDGHATNGQASGTISVDINTDNWDGQGGHLLFAQENSSTHVYEAAGGAGSDILIGGSHDDILYGGAGDDILYGGAGHNELYGGDGNDTLYAGNAGDHLYGDAGNDHLYGGTGNDFLDGGANTFVTDGGGNHLYGGAGNDVLVFHQGDTIDGGSGTDMLLVKGGSVDALFTGAEHVKGVDGITGVEVMVSTSGDALNNLTDMAEIASKTGVSISTGSDGSTAVSFDASHSWTTTTQTASNGTVWDVHSTTITTDSGSEAVQVAVQHLTTNQGG
ncbi:VCBS domain-containing protein [uncultured Desulfovibrio sp.]|uniref:VCBS domain-containing protein n=1 Tax=uncultured Desulfovibrio sp. TaxID=167968 RepID=UPI00286928F9|nr:VCBS domain-containing protein [uncultured Desulfovibrio sp.]